jgi:hypothetical protein
VWDRERGSRKASRRLRREGSLCKWVGREEWAVEREDAMDDEVVWIEMDAKGRRLEREGRRNARQKEGEETPSPKRN